MFRCSHGVGLAAARAQYIISYGREKLLLVWGEGKVFIASGLIMWGHSSFASTVPERGSPFYGAGESSSQFSPW